MTRAKPFVVAIIQARMGSSRLPGKSVAPIAGKPLLTHVIERVQASTQLDGIIVATTTAPEDIIIVNLARSYGLATYTGSVDDVLDRFFRAAQQAKADVIVRITADDPFKDPQIIDRFVEHFLKHPELDFLGDDHEQPTYPEGLAISIFSFAALSRAWRQAVLPSEREHVVPYFWHNPQQFVIGCLPYPQNLSHLRWTLDYEADLYFAREIYRRLGAKGLFYTQDILDLLQTAPQLVQINQNIERDAGYRQSLQQDALVKTGEAS